jgi:F420H(2)-dependent quinone reductase
VDPARIARFTNRSARQRNTSVPFARAHARLYRASGGRLARRWFGAPVLVLETVGRRSGQPRATPVLFADRDGDPVVLAANAGARRSPAWWLNLRDAGHGVAVIGRERREVRPRVAEGAERVELWARLCEIYPAAAHYPEFTERELPVVVLERAVPEL